MGRRDAAVALAVADSRAPLTRQAYRSDWCTWAAWCDLEEETPLTADPEVVARFLVLADQVGYLR